MDLRELRNKRRSMDILRERIDCINADIMRVTTVPRNMPSGGGYASDALASKVAKLMDMRNELLDRCIEYEATVSHAQAVLEGLPGAEQYIMSLRYIKGLPWGRVARESGYSIDACFKIHARARKRLQ